MEPEVVGCVRDEFSVSRGQNSANTAAFSDNKPYDLTVTKLVE